MAEKARNGDTHTKIDRQPLKPRPAKGGRAKGTGNKPKPEDLTKAMFRHGKSPLEFLIAVYQNEEIETGFRVDAAKAAAPYCHRKLPLAIETELERIGTFENNNNMDIYNKLYVEQPDNCEAGKYVDSFLETLCEREKKVIKQCYGIGGVEHTLSDIAPTVGVSREMVRQIKDKAIYKIRAKIKIGLLCRNKFILEIAGIYGA